MGVAQLNTFSLLNQLMEKRKDIDLLIGKTLRKARLEKNLSQEKLAEFANFERSYVSKVENGERAIQLITFIRFAKALDLKPSDLIKDFENKIKI